MCVRPPHKLTLVFTNVRQSSLKGLSKTGLSGMRVSSSATTPSYTWLVIVSNFTDPVGRTCILVAEILSVPESCKESNIALHTYLQT